MIKITHINYKMTGKIKIIHQFKSNDKPYRHGTRLLVTRYRLIATGKLLT